jgi:hypothetical protein
MKTMYKYFCFPLMVALIVALGCEDTPDISDIDARAQSGVQVIGDTNYVEILPPWGGVSVFESPTAILIGNDQLLYVADYDKNQLVMMDAGGTILSIKSILHPISIAQNTQLDLFVGGETITSKGDTIGAIYKIYLVRFDTTYYDTLKNSFNRDSIVSRLVSNTKIQHNFDVAHTQIVFKEQAKINDHHRRYTGIGILPPTNEYLVARTGPDNSSFVDPDTRVLRFNRGDTLVTPLADLITRPSGGTAITDIRNLTGLMVFPKSKDFILTQTTEGVAYGAVWMIYKSGSDFEGWVSKFDLSTQGIRSDFIRQNQFKDAAGAAYDSRRREIFIVDAGWDSVFKFDKNGSFKSESFGKSRTKVIDEKTKEVKFKGLDRPRGVAFSNDCTLYVADTGNKYIRRFRLSTQTTCF